MLKLKRQAVKLLEENRQLTVKYTENFKFNKENFEFSDGGEDDYQAPGMPLEPSEDTLNLVHSFSDISRRLKDNANSTLLFRESIIENGSVGKSRTSMRYARAGNSSIENDNKNATEQKILNQLNKRSMNGFLSPGEDKLGRIMGTQLKFDSNEKKSVENGKMVSQQNFKKSRGNFSNISINKNLVQNQPFQKNLINEFRNMTSAKKMPHRH